ncbi:ShlB/FhaC/HecB family hemolysin secretion/activation protein [Variovorax terrae]|uniref:ShlB/FhaC/HecB family hemolysin secretion/activation protein n=1 Tax=Variovorax terrae TaxID=2923278 RepID=A0A9X2AMJ8_9BURK|nr:ShlB/FhaC/HecB family hemolysin secretion/activation protein [Variovorax terrae]MCJ0763429.1 ShlB/FhaC/HecB family hemolysin secretion/activation protein [Variovorax terrae]
MQYRPSRFGAERAWPSRRAWAVGVGAVLAASAAQAQVSPIDEARRQSQIIERQQQERLREAQERALPPPAAPQGADLKDMQPQIGLPDVGPGCHNITELRIEGAQLLGTATRAALGRDVAGRCLAASDIQALLALLTKDYIDRGYITTRVYLPAQDLGSGVLTLQVVEGTIERYRVEQDGRDAGSLSVRSAFPGRPGEPLNLRDLEQGLEQINNLRSNTARLDLEPGSQPGQSVVVVRNHAERPVHLQLTYDNLGSPSTGRDNVAATMSFDSLLGLNELIMLTRNQTVPDHGAHKANGTALRVALPWGYNTFSLDASESNYTNGLALPSGAPVEATGRTTSYGLGLSRVVLRNQASRVSLTGRLATSDSRNYLSGQLLTVSSRKLATLNLGVNGFTQLAGGAFSGGLGYVRGLGALGALRDLPGTPDDYPHAQFDKFTLDLGYQRRLQAGPLPLQWTSQFSGQYSRQTLYGSQQFLIGSPATVRGSLLNALSGDHGMLLRNDIAWPWRAKAGDSNSVSGVVYVGWDIGRVNNHAGGDRLGSMTGATLGVAGQWKRFNFEVFASRAVHLPAFLTHEGTLYGVRLSYSM